MGTGLEKLTVVSDTIHGAYLYCPADIFLFARIGRLLIHIVVRRIVAVHEVLQGIRKTDAASVARTCYVVLACHVFLEPDHYCGHTESPWA
jgi:hypothetical protein